MTKQFVVPVGSRFVNLVNLYFDGSKMDLKCKNSNCLRMLYEFYEQFNETD